MRWAKRQCESSVLVRQANLKLTDDRMAFNAQSHLLKLPQEIKDHIYVLVCGGNLLHLDFGSSVPYIQFRHMKCLSKATEEDAQASFDASVSPWFDEVNVNRHEDCVFGRFSPKPTLDLRFLRTCRQIHEEAKSFCYTANTFSFDGWNTLRELLATVSWTSYIRSVHLCIRSGTNGEGPVPHNIMQRISSKLTGLRSIHYSLDQCNVYRSRKYNQEVEKASHLTEQLLCLAGTAVKTATVVISDAYYHNFKIPEITQPPRDDARSQGLGRWTMAQKQEYSQFLQNAILQHRGKRVHIEGDGGISRPTRI